jgi:hypothetical protein
MTLEGFIRDWLDLKREQHLRVAAAKALLSEARDFAMRAERLERKAAHADPDAEWVLDGLRDELGSDDADLLDEAIAALGERSSKDFDAGKLSRKALSELAEND